MTEIVPTESESATERSTKHVEEVTRVDFEKMIAAAGPHAEAAIRAWHTGHAERIQAGAAADVEKARVAETHATRRHLAVSVTLGVTIAAVVALAAYVAAIGQGATAEKIVIGLFGFLAGLGVPRR